MNFRAASILLIAFIAFSFTQQTNDECEPYFPITKGTTWEYNEYDKKGELAGTNTTIVEDVVSTATRIEYQLKGIHDGPKKKEKNHYEQDILYVCENGVFKMSLENMIDQSTMESLGESATITIDQSEMTIPKSLNVGDELEDAFISMKAEINGMSVMNMKVEIYDRKVEKTEEITTPAGTYSCALMTYKTKSKMGFANIESSNKDWYAADVGIVKSETYDKNGDLEGSRELVSYKSGQ